MSYTFRIEHFEGPLDLLLQLVESEDLDISTVSLATVADQFLQYVQSSEHLPLEETADFLVVAAKLIYLKSKLLLPSLLDQELEEGPDLETQLRRYRAFVDASKYIDEVWRSDRRSFSRVKQMDVKPIAQFAPAPNATCESMLEAMRRVVARLEPLRKLPKTTMERVITIQEKIRGLLSRIKDLTQTTFHEFVGGQASRPEKIVSFLALLELVKQRFVRVAQQDLFHDINIESHPEAPQQDPLANSFI